MIAGSYTDVYRQYHAGFITSMHVDYFASLGIGFHS